MRFFAYVATMALSANAVNVFTQAEKEELFEVWTAQAESGEISPEVYFTLAQALDGDASPEFYAECDSMAEATEIPTEFLEVESERRRGRRGKKYASSNDGGATHVIKTASLAAAAPAETAGGAGAGVIADAAGAAKKPRAKIIPVKK